jgi:hypothetical protein
MMMKCPSGRLLQTRGSACVCKRNGRPQEAGKVADMSDKGSLDAKQAAAQYMDCYSPFL